MQHAPDAAQVCIKKDPCAGTCIKMVCAIPAWPELLAILAEGAIALSVTHSLLLRSVTHCIASMHMHYLEYEVAHTA